MRKWMLLAVLIMVACVGSWIFLQRHRANVWDDAFIDASEAYARGDYAKAEGILIPVEAGTEKWWTNSPRYFGTDRTPARLDLSCRPQVRPSGAAASTRDQSGFVDSVRGWLRYRSRKS
jgi:hypothetical protein